MALTELLRLADRDGEGELLGEEECEPEAEPLNEADSEAVQLGGPHSPCPLQGQYHWHDVGALTPGGQKEPLGQLSGVTVPLGQ